MRKSFAYGRSFAGDADLNAQVEWWLGTVANVRLHGTTRERPVDRFERDERSVPRPLAPRPYHSLALPAGDAPEEGRRLRSVPRITIERRPLAEYARLAAGAS